MLSWLGANTTPESVAEAGKRLDAVLEFTGSGAGGHVNVIRPSRVGGFTLAGPPLG